MFFFTKVLTIRKKLTRFEHWAVSIFKTLIYHDFDLTKNAKEGKRKENPK